MTQQEQLEAKVRQTISYAMYKATVIGKANSSERTKKAEDEAVQAITALIQEARDEGYMQGVKDEVECKVTFPHDHPHLKYEQGNSGGSNLKKDIEGYNLAIADIKQSLERILK